MSHTVCKPGPGQSKIEMGMERKIIVKKRMRKRRKEE